MKPFLQHIVDDLDTQNPLALKDKCFVFPSRRACVYFNDLLQKKFHDKVLSVNAQVLNLKRISFEFSEVNFRSNWSMILATLLDFLFSFNWGVDFELTIDDLDFLNIVLPGFKWDFKIPPFELVDLDFRFAFERSMIRKGYYGVTRYDYSYYDPGFTIEKIRDESKHSLVRSSKEYSIDKILSFAIMLKSSQVHY